MSRNLVKRAVVVAAFFLVVGFFLISIRFYKKQLPTYFHYEEAPLNSLRDLKSEQEMTLISLTGWAEQAFELVAKNKKGSSLAAKVYAYLLVAQRDAAFLSHNIYGDYRGSIEPISKAVLCLFFPEDCATMRVTSDPYSEELANVVMSKVRSRIEEDKKRTKDYQRPEGDDYWVARGVARGKNTGSWMPWLIESVEDFRIAPPPKPASAAEQKQLMAVKDVYSKLTEDQKRAVVRWAGGNGTKRPAGQWLDLAQNHIRKANSKLGQALIIRSVLAMGIMDAYIAANDAKYTYWAKRPFMKDSTLQTYMPTPNHPSYPSSAASVAGVSSQLLSHYFPENREAWLSAALEAKDSRIWSGIHYPVDVAQGFNLGQKIAKYINESLS